MNIVWVLGGLGNQLFQFALYYWLSKKDGSVRIDISGFESYSKHDGFSLINAFKINPRISTTEELDLVIKRTKISRFIFKINQALILLFDYQLFYYKGYILEYYKSKKNDKLFNLSNRYFFGYWQQQDYLIEIRENLITELKFNIDLADLSAKSNYFFNLIKQDSTVCLHVRGGDYQDRWRLDKDYYTRAIGHLKNIIEIKSIVVFTDDRKFAESILFDFHFSFFENDQNYPSYIEMFLMSHAKNLIIANSSFSWWAAYLNTNHINIIAPKKWLSLEHNSLKLFSVYKDYKPPFLKDWVEV